MFAQSVKCAILIQLLRLTTHKGKTNESKGGGDPKRTGKG